MNPTPHAARPDAAGLATLLAERARRASDARLVADAAGGLVAAGLLIAIRPPAWLPLACAAICFTAFGAWGIADRELGERVSRAPASAHAMLRGLRLLAALLGAATAALFGLLLLGRALGTWIS